MRKIYLFVAMLAGTACIAQPNRLVLLEHFTQASCGPCASSNPRISEIINANPEKVIAIKYQVSWPGVDPMYDHNRAEVDNRVSYYTVVGVPNSVLDGNFYNGHPNYWDESFLDTRRAVASPFKIDVTHRLSAAKDSIIAHVKVTALTDVVGSSLKAHIAVIERNIYFSAPPGTNGEKHFEHVMKKMLPNQLGNTLPNSWAANHVVEITQSWKLKNIYDMKELGVVVFVQDNTTKEVHQAAYSSPLVVGIAEESSSVFKAYHTGEAVRIILHKPMNEHILNLYNTSGQLISSVQVEPGMTELSILTNGYPAGIYLAALADPSGLLLSPTKIQVLR